MLVIPGPSAGVEPGIHSPGAWADTQQQILLAVNMDSGLAPLARPGMTAVDNRDKRRLPGRARPVWSI